MAAQTLAVDWDELDAAGRHQLASLLKRRAEALLDGLASLSPANSLGAPLDETFAGLGGLLAAIGRGEVRRELVAELARRTTQLGPTLEDLARGMLTAQGKGNGTAQGR